MVTHNLFSNTDSKINMFAGTVVQKWERDMQHMSSCMIANKFDKICVYTYIQAEESGVWWVYMHVIVIVTGFDPWHLFICQNWPHNFFLPSFLPSFLPRVYICLPVNCFFSHIQLMSWASTLLMAKTHMCCVCCFRGHTRINNSKRYT
jgi:hypothetical protein